MKLDRPYGDSPLHSKMTYYEIIVACKVYIMPNEINEFFLIQFTCFIQSHFLMNKIICYRN